MRVPLAAREELSRLVEGRVIAADDPDYDEARRTFNGMIDRRPLAIVRPAGAGDVSSAVRWAAAAGVPVAIRGGGHSVAGHAVADDALVIDLSQRRAAAVDPDARVATAEGGCQWLDLDTATQAHGLAVVGGTFVDTGIAGLTLGGGIGYLMGTQGLTCDNLIGAELVQADGEVRRVDAATDPELLWALRGGGGNFGVVTRFSYALRPVGEMYGGTIYYASSRVTEVLRLVRDLLAEAPDELVVLVYVGGRRGFDVPVTEVIVAFDGPPDQGARAVRPLRAARPILADNLRPISYLDLQGTNALIPFGIRHYWKGHFVRELSDDVTEIVADAIRQHEGPLGGMLIEMLHGAVKRIDADHAAFGQRAAAANVSATGAWRDASMDVPQIAWVRSTAEALLPHSLTGAGYVNYASPDEPASRVEAAFGPTRFARLAAVKARVDPDNLFRFNLNIPPATA